MNHAPESCALVRATPAPLVQKTGGGDFCTTPVCASPDLVALLLEDKRSAATKRAYSGDLAHFFGSGGKLIHSEAVAAFVALEPSQIALALAQYKSRMRLEALAEATINRRLAAVRSLLKFAHRLGYAKSDGSGLVDGERVIQYRDTRGVDLDTLRRLIRLPDELFAPKEKEGSQKENSPCARTHTGKHGYVSILANTCIGDDSQENTRRELRRRRDIAILRLLIENALRRAEVCRLTLADFEARTRTLWILGKGKGTQKERITLSGVAAGSLEEYLRLAGHCDGEIFRAVDNAHFGAPLTTDGLYQLIGFYGRAAGLSRLTPHQLRHSSITAALDATGDVRRVQRLSRHRKLETLIRYDDNRQDLQGEVTGVLSGLLDEPKKKRGR